MHSPIAVQIHGQPRPDGEARYGARVRILLPIHSHATPHAAPVNILQRAVDLNSRNPPLKLDREFDVTKAYAEAVKEVGKTEGVPVLDVWTAFYEAAGCDEASLEKFLVDGLHLNAEAYTIVYDLLILTLNCSCVIRKFLWFFLKISPRKPGTPHRIELWGNLVVDNHPTQINVVFDRTPRTPAYSGR